MAINPNDFTTTIDNPYFSLKPGTTFVYKTLDGSEVVRFVVTRETQVVDGVTCVVVNDTSVENGVLHESTRDYFAQDLNGNVWYFGEDVKNYVDGKFDNTNGSWLAGVNGADPGIVMQAVPVVGQTYNQENAPGIAEDKATILSLTAAVNVAYGDFSSVLQTHDFTPLELALNEEKFYVSGLGLVRSDNRLTGESEALVRTEFDGTGQGETITGNIGTDILRGKGGSDTIDGQGGHDRLDGGLGADILTGGLGGDSFDFNRISDSGKSALTRDVITDFEHGKDKIDLQTLDAQLNQAGNQSFDFIGKNGFSHTGGELRYKAVSGVVVVEGDVNGDGRADFQIELQGLTKLVAADFLL